MKQCDECAERIDFYMDDELLGEDLEYFENHVAGCTSCHELLTERQDFLEGIRSRRPLYTAPCALRARVEERLAAEPGMPRATPKLRREVQSILVAERGRSWPARLCTKPLSAAATACLVILGVSMLWLFSEQEARANAFVNMAVKTHQQQLAGLLPIEVKTDSPVDMTGWFANKVSFKFRLPTYQEGPGQNAKFTLVGGRLVNFRSEYAAYVAYRMKDKLISLVITSAHSSKASGGETTEARGLVFHSHRSDGLEVVTWSAHDVTYALVSSLDVSARQACNVCHLSSDRDLISRSWLGDQKEAGSRPAR